jgi:CheY-like chemotaxis protein
MDKSTSSTTLSQCSPAAPPILIVDDDRPTRDILRTILEAEGYPVAVTDTVDKASAQLRATTTGHVVLLDWILGGRNSGNGANGRNGGALLRQLEQDAALRQHCYVLLTAAVLSLVLDEEEQHLIYAHCMDVVEKPFDLSTLLDTVSQAARQLRVQVSSRSSPSGASILADIEHPRT